jgi:hypothetical protein
MMLHMDERSIQKCHCVCAIYEGQGFLTEFIVFSFTLKY